MYTGCSFYSDVRPTEWSRPCTRGLALNTAFSRPDEFVAPFSHASNFGAVQRQVESVPVWLHQPWHHHVSGGKKEEFM
jgi:hypothetical protein